MFTRLALSYINATLPDTDATSLRVVGARIAAIGEPPQPRDVVIDLDGDWLLPGFINAHDHLELNNFPRLKWRERYANAREWIADFQPRFKTDTLLVAAHAVPLDDRLLIGGLKNLLSGVTTVAHHNPLHPALKRDDFPVRVMRRYAWAHSLGVDGDAQVSSSYRRARKDWPWIIHLAEGVDEEAAGELMRLDALGCLQTNTLIVHGVGLSAADRWLLVTREAGLIWCPSSNIFLFGRAADVTNLVARGRVALGSDSRLSGARDLLEELRVAREVSGLDNCALFKLVTTNAARLLRLTDVGALRVGALADLIVLPATNSPLLAGEGQGVREKSAPSHLARHDIRLVVIGGRALYAAPRYEKIFAATGMKGAPVRVDGCEKILERSIAARLRRCSLQETGLEL